MRILEELGVVVFIFCVWMCGGGWGAAFKVLHV